MHTPIDVKMRVFKAAEIILKEMFNLAHGDDKGKCLYATICFKLAMAVVCPERRVIVQAGDCFWRRLVDEKDEQAMFGFAWDPDSAMSAMSVAAGNLPEMHIWAALPETQEIVDMTAGEFPAMCKRMMVGDWPYKTPPKYLWAKAGDKWRYAATYLPNEAATKTACDYAFGHPNIKATTILNRQKTHNALRAAGYTI